MRRSVGRSAPRSRGTTASRSRPRPAGSTTGCSIEYRGALGPRRRRRQRALRPGEGAPARAGSPRSRTRSSSSSAAPTGAARDGPRRLLGELAAERAHALRARGRRATRTCSTSTSAARSASRLGHPLLLVCTHGKHDRCCARHGRPLYDALAEQADDGWVWQSPHVGGDRFAGNVVVLPRASTSAGSGPRRPGRCWTSTSPAASHLDLYRGRSAYTFAVQAAERAVRERGGPARRRRPRARRGARRAGSSSSRPARRVYEVERHRRAGELTYLTCHATELRHPRRYVAGSPPRISRLTRTRRPVLVEVARQLGGGERSPPRRRTRRAPPQPAPGRSTSLALEGERRPVEVDEHGVAALDGVSTVSASSARSSPAGRRGPAGGFRRSAPGASGARPPRARAAPARRSSRSASSAPSAGDRAAELDVVRALVERGPDRVEPRVRR